MNLYGIIGLILLILICGEYFHLVEPVQRIANGISNLFAFQSQRNTSPILNFGYVMMIYISIVGIIRMIIRNSKGDGSE